MAIDHLQKRKHATVITSAKPEFADDELRRLARRGVDLEFEGNGVATRPWFRRAETRYSRHPRNNTGRYPMRSRRPCMSRPKVSQSLARQRKTDVRNQNGTVKVKKRARTTATWKV
jgi:hypothetical protein